MATLPDNGHSRTSRLLAVILVALPLAIYAQTLGFEFNYFDDPLYLTENEFVRDGLTARGLQYALSAEPAPITNPLALIVHMANVELFGLAPGGHHAVNVLLHTLNTLLLFVVLARATKSPLRSAFVAAIFAVHPFQVENVAWISDLKDPLSALFWLLAAYAYLSYVERPSWPRNLAVALLFFLSLLAKPMAVTFPCVLLLLDFWPLQRAKLNFAEWAKWRKLILEKWLLFLLAGLAAAVTWWLQARAGASDSLEHLSLATRFGNACLAYLTYVAKTFWPVNFAVFYPHPEAGLSRVAAIASALILLALSAIIVWRRDKFGAAFTGWFWFLGMLVPVIGIVQVGSQAYADRYTYLPIAGLALAVAWTVSELSPAGQRPLLVYASAPIIAVLALLSFRQTALWKTSEGIFEHTLAITGPNAPMETNLGRYFLDEKRYGEALPHLERALELKPDGPVNHLNIGRYRTETGDDAAAANHFQRAWELDPTDERAPYNLGLLATGAGQFAEALPLLEAAMERNQRDADIHAAIGRVYYELGAFETAARYADSALVIDSDHVEALANLGLALINLGRADEGLTALAQAVKLDPENPLARMNLANQLARAGRIDEALEHYTEALALLPGDPVLHFNAALAYEIAGRREEAIHHYEQALQSDAAFTAAQERLEKLRESPR